MDPDAVIPSWSQMFLKELQFNYNQSTVPIAMRQASDAADRWDAIDPDRKPEDDSREVLPGLHVRNKKATDSGIKETVRRELISMISKNLGNTGISLYTLDTDIGVILDGFSKGVEAVSGSMVIDDRAVMGGAPTTTVDHDQTQLWWGRVSQKHPDKKVPPCIYGEEHEGTTHVLCYAKTLVGAPSSSLQMWLSPSQQLQFDEDGIAPTPGPCLLCIRRNLQKLALTYGTEINMQQMVGKRLIVPPFSIMLDHPGGYNSRFCITPASSQVVMTPFPMNCGQLTVRTNETGDRFYVDQGGLVFNVADAESSN